VKISLTHGKFSLFLPPLFGTDKVESIQLIKVDLIRLVIRNKMHTSPPVALNPGPSPNFFSFLPKDGSPQLPVLCQSDG
jgi:hypothetical protein